jgi:O-antigen ligase
MGRGAFTGIMMHSMLLAPIAGMAVLFSVHRAIFNRSILFLVIAILLLIPCMLAGSRSSILSVIFGLVLLLSLGLPKVSLRGGLLLLALIFLVGSSCLLFYKNFLHSDLTYRYTSTLQEKGLQNTRERLWAARMDEFQDKPLVGVGIGMGYVMKRSGVLQDESGKVNIEPGSSYLAILSMTGLFGAIGFLLVIVRLFRLYLKVNVPRSDPRLSEALAIIAFFSIHLGAEGYIFAVGNSLCLFFWLALGRVQDLLTKNDFEMPSGQHSIAAGRFADLCLK